ncbi:hypothetical protein ACWCMN_11125, partial [Pasteurella multocida]
AIHSWEISAIGQYNLLYAIKPITGFPIIDVWFMDEFYRTKVIQNTGIDKPKADMVRIPFPKKVWLFIAPMSPNGMPNNTASKI